MSENSQPTEAYDATQDPGNAAQKPGFKTTEFWLSLAAMLLSALVGSGLLDAIPGEKDDQLVAMAVSVLAALGYSAQRMIVKASGNKSAALVAASQPPSSPTNPS